MFLKSSSSALEQWRKRQWLRWQARFWKSWQKTMASCCFSVVTVVAVVLFTAC